MAFGVFVRDERAYQRWALPSILKAAEPDSVLLKGSENDSIFSAYNEMIDYARGDDRIEALILLHDDVELRDKRLVAKIRAALAPARGPVTGDVGLLGEVGVLGAVGAVGVSSVAWWMGRGRGRYQETRGLIDFGGGTCDVETVDGMFMVVSRRALSSIRFDDERYDGFDGYDIDYCFGVRRVGLRVMVTDLDVFHHTGRGLGHCMERSPERSDRVFRRKWSVPSPPAPAAIPEIWSRLESRVSELP